MSHRARAVYMYLHDRADKDGKCYPAIGTIARELKLSRSTVKRAITDLEQSGRLRKEQRWRENGGKSSNLYYIKQPDS
nr:helix-turn-helix domain-containing protein [Lutispora saccharofermentans]